MDYEHFMRARTANAGQMGEPRDPLTVAKAITQLGALLQENADTAMTAIAALNDLCEAGADDEDLFTGADALGVALAEVVAVGYRLAAAMWLPSLDGQVSTALANAAQ